MSFRVYQECRSAAGWQEVVVPASNPELNDPYRVLLPPWNYTERDYRDKLTEPVCECESYLRRGWCRHQEEAVRLGCRWSELNPNAKPQTEADRESNTCPQCGDRTRTIIEDTE